MSSVATQIIDRPLEQTTLVRIALSPDLLAHFEGLAIINGLPLESVIVNHLARTRNQVADASPIYLNDAQAQEVRRLLGGRITTPDKLLDMVRRLVTWKVGGQKIELSPSRAEAAVWYAKSLQMPLEQAIPQMIDRALGLLLKC